MLTGAGFTETFGGYLATEMWAAIFNQPEVQKSDKLLKGMREELNYEIFYDHVQAHGKDHEKKALSDAVRGAFDEMEAVLDQRQGVSGERHEAVACCTSFITRLAPGPGPHFVFTLNQDMFFERFHSHEVTTQIPGVEQDPHWFKSVVAELERKNIRLPTEEELERRKGVEIQVSTPVEMNGYKFPQSTTLVFFHDKLQFASIYYDKEFMGQLLPAKTMILFTPSGRIDHIVLGGDASINGVSFKTNDELIFNEGNKRFERRTEALTEPNKRLQRTRHTEPRS
jgi:hypothetical protein